MNANLDHETCSELLTAYTAGELDSERREAVAVHLRGCTECRSEALGVSMLLSAPVQPLTEAERGELHRRIAARTAGRPVVRPRRARGEWRRRVAPALGAAAVLAVVAAGIFYAGAGLSGDDAGSTAGTAGPRPAVESAPEAGGAQDAAGGGAPGPARYDDRDLNQEEAESLDKGRNSARNSERAFAVTLAYRNQVRAAAGAVLGALGAKLPSR